MVVTGGVVRAGGVVGLLALFVGVFVVAGEVVEERFGFGVEQVVLVGGGAFTCGSGVVGVFGEVSDAPGQGGGQVG